MRLICDPEFIASLQVNDRVLMHSEYKGTRIGYGTVERVTHRQQCENAGADASPFVRNNGTAAVRLDGDSRPYTISLSGSGAPVGFSLAKENYSLHRDQAALDQAIAFRLKIVLGLMDDLCRIRQEMAHNDQRALQIAAALSDEMMTEVAQITTITP